MNGEPFRQHGDTFFWIESDEHAWKHMALRRGDPRRAAAERHLYGQVINPPTEIGFGAYNDGPSAWVTDTQPWMLPASFRGRRFLVDPGAPPAPRRTYSFPALRTDDGDPGEPLGGYLVPGDWHTSLVTPNLIREAYGRSPLADAAISFLGTPRGPGHWTEGAFKDHIHVGVDRDRMTIHVDPAIREDTVYFRASTPGKGPGKYTTSIPVSREMLRDSAFDMEAEIKRDVIDQFQAAHAKEMDRLIYGTGEPVSLTVEKLAELRRGMLAEYTINMTKLPGMTYGGRPVVIEEPTTEEELPMDFHSFNLRAAPEVIGERQLLDIPRDATVRFAAIEEANDERVVRVTYSQPTHSTAKPRPAAFIVVDTAAEFSGASDLEDQHGSRQRGDHGGGFSEAAEKRFEQAQKVNRVASADGLIIFEAL